MYFGTRRCVCVYARARVRFSSRASNYTSYRLTLSAVTLLRNPLVINYEQQNFPPPSSIPQVIVLCKLWGKATVSMKVCIINCQHILEANLQRFIFSEVNNL